MARAGKTNLFACLLLGISLASAAYGQDQPPAVVDCYKAVLADGREIAGPAFDGWKDQNRQPTLAGANIFDQNNPVRMLWDVRRKPNLNGSYIEFTNGDILPGQLKGYLPADLGSGLPPRLYIELASPVKSFRSNQDTIVRADRVRRIVQTDNPMEEYQAGSVIFKDGKRSRYNSIKLTSEGIVALDADGVKEISYGDLAEAHLPAESCQEAAIRELTGLCPVPQSLVIRFTTAEGGIFTFRHAMMIRGEEYNIYSAPPNPHPYSVIQPSWSMSGIKIPMGDICIISCCQANELPGSLLNVKAISEKSYTGMMMRWRRNCNVRGLALESGNIVTNLGIGAHSFSQIAIGLPESAQSFSCMAGMDRAVGNGGCVEVRIYKDQAAGEAVWKSGFIRGGEKPVRVGPINVEGAKQIVLECDYGHNGRPAGAEPFDIRDEFDWLVPVVTVDASKLPKPDLVHVFPQFAGWKLDKVPDKIDFTPVWNDQNGSWYSTMIMPAGQPLILSKQITPSKKQAIFEIRMGRPEKAKNWDHSVSLKINDKPIPEITTLFRPDAQRNHYVNGTMGFVPLEPYFGNKADLSLTIQREQAAAKDTNGLAMFTLGVTPISDEAQDETAEKGESIPLNNLIRTYSKNGSGQIRKDRSYNDGLIRIHGVSYQTGLSVYMFSVAKFELGRKYKTFISDIGIDDLTCGNGYANFEVWADDTKLYESGIIRGGKAARHVNVDVTGRQELKLVVKSNEHGSYACWAGPRLIKDPDAANQVASDPEKNADKSIKAEYFLGKGGVNFDGKDDSSYFQNLQNDMAERLKSLQLAEPPEGGIGTLIRCYIVPPQSGEYTFFICSDDASRLWLSSSEDPAGKKKIAFVNGSVGPDTWDIQPNQKSPPIKLEKGKRYYMEIVHIDGGGAVHLAVGWQLPDKTLERPIPTSRLEYYEPPKAAPKTTQKVDFPKEKIVKIHKIGTVKLDGDLDEWKNIPSMPLPFMNKTESSVRLAWREDGLYGAVQTKDDNIRIDEANPWVGDCLELWIDKDCSRVADIDTPNKAAQYAFAPNPGSNAGNGIIVLAWGAEIDSRDNLKCASKKTSEGYNLEFFLPARVLEPAAMKVGTLMGLNFALDNNGKAVEQFFRDKDVESAFRRPALWGVIELAE